MEHTKAYKEYKKNGNTKFVRYSKGAEMYHMSVSKFMQMAKDAKAVYKLGQPAIPLKEQLFRQKEGEENE